MDEERRDYLEQIRRQIKNETNDATQQHQKENYYRGRKLTALERVFSILEASEFSNALYQASFEDKNFVATYITDVFHGIASGVTGVQTRATSRKHGADILERMGWEQREGKIDLADVAGLFIDLVDPAVVGKGPVTLATKAGKALTKTKIAAKGITKSKDILSPVLEKFDKFHHIKKLNQMTHPSGSKAGVHTVDEIRKTGDAYIAAYTKYVGTSNRGQFFTDVARLGKRTADDFVDEAGMPWRRIKTRGVGSLGYIRFPEPIAKHIEDFLITPQVPDTRHAALKAYDDILTGIKKFVTVIHPAFHTRNIASGVGQNYLSGMNQLATKDALKILRYKAHKVKTPFGEKTISDIENIAFKHHLYKNGGIGNADRARAIELTKQIMQGVPEEEAVRKISKYADKDVIKIASFNELDLGKKTFEMLRDGVDATKKIPLGVYGDVTYKEIESAARKWGVIGQAGRMDVDTGMFYKVGSAVEDRLRLPLFIDGLRKGLTYENAAKRVTRAHFEYRPEFLTDFEKNVMKRIDPWYAYHKGLFSHEAGLMLDKGASKLTRMGKFTTIGKDDDRGHRPIWQRNQVTIGDIVGTGFMFEDFLRAMEDPKSFAFGTLPPHLSFLPEVISGYNAFKDQPIRQDTTGKPYKNAPQYLKYILDYTTDPYGNAKVNPVKKYFLEKLGSRGLSSSLKVAGGENGIDIWSLFFSIKSQPYNSQQRQYFEKLLKEEGNASVFDSLSEVFASLGQVYGNPSLPGRALAAAGAIGDPKIANFLAQGKSNAALSLLSGSSGSEIGILANRLSEYVEKNQKLVELNQDIVKSASSIISNKPSAHALAEALVVSGNSDLADPKKRSRDVVLPTVLSGKEWPNLGSAIGMLIDKISGYVDNNQKIANSNQTVINSILKISPQNAKEWAATYGKSPDEYSIAVGQYQGTEAERQRRLRGLHSVNLSAAYNEAAGHADFGKRAEGYLEAGKLDILQKGQLFGFQQNIIDSTIKALEQKYKMTRPRTLEEDTRWTSEDLKYRPFQGNISDAVWYQKLLESSRDIHSKTREREMAYQPESTHKIQLEMQQDKATVEWQQKYALVKMTDEEYNRAIESIQNRALRKQAQLYEELTRIAGEHRNYEIEAEEDKLKKIELQRADALKDFEESEKGKLLLRERLFDEYKKIEKAINAKYDNEKEKELREISRTGARAVDAVMREDIRTKLKEAEALFETTDVELKNYFTQRREVISSMYGEIITEWEKQAAKEKDEQEKIKIYKKISKAQADRDQEIAKETISENKAKFQLGQSRISVQQLIQDTKLKGLPQRGSESTLGREDEWVIREEAFNKETERIAESRARDLQGALDKEYLIRQYHEARVDELEEQRRQFDRETIQMKLDGTSTMLSNLASVFEEFYEQSGEQSKEAFYLWKTIKLAETIVTGASSIMKAWDNGLAMDKTGTMAVINAAITSAMVGMQIGTIVSQMLATGGPIVGGSGAKDDVVIAAMGGEYVLNKHAVARYGMPFLDALNQRRIDMPASITSGRAIPSIIAAPPGTVPGFAGGGPVPYTSSSSAKEKQSLTIANFVDPTLMKQFLATTDGQQAIINVMTKHAYKMRKIFTP